MSAHAGPPPPPGAASAPEPSPPERACTLVHLGRTGMLATVSRRHPGHPFGSVMPYGLDERGRPTFLISRLAVHTQNLQADGRASLLVTAPGAALDPLASARVTLIGVAARVDGAEAGAVRERYLARHPRAAHWVDFDDFGFWWLDVAEAYWVGGFGAMDWVSAAALAAARPDPLAEAADDIREHVNRDHAEALALLARRRVDEAAAEATMRDVDRLGFTLSLSSGGRRHAVRVAFPREVRTPAEARAALIEMLRACRAPRPASP